MIKTLNKHVKWRRDKKQILICDCKRLIDLKVPFEFERAIKKIERGINKNKLSGTERSLFLDFEKLKMISNLEIRRIKNDEFQEAMGILDNELKVRIRDNNFLLQKFEEFPQFFIGVFLDNELIGVVCGFPREDYLLMSEIAVDCRFQRRGFGERLVKEFEKIRFKKHSKIEAGAFDGAIEFYKSLNYKPFLLVQFKKGIYNKRDFSNFEILTVRDYGFELKVNTCSLDGLNKLRKIYPKANLQYIFTKDHLTDMLPE